MNTAVEWEKNEMEAFAYSVSHDLRAPLHAIVGFSSILLEENGNSLTGRAEHYLEIVRSNATQLERLLDGLLAFSRLGRQELCKEPLQPAALARAALEEFDMPRKDRVVNVTILDMPACQGDPLLLKQVFSNLLSNALKYTRKRAVAKIDIGTVRLSELRKQQPALTSQAEEADCAVYYVRDNGVGFEMHHAGKLFGIFQRLHSPDEFEGTGVGLANVQRIIHRHGGSLWAEAKLNEGAAFYFTVGHAACQEEAEMSKLEVTAV